MDVSKLPKLSDTQKEQQAQAVAQDDPALARAPAESSARAVAAVERADGDISMMGGAEAWVSAIVGIICLMLSKSFLAYLVARMTGSAFHTGVNWTSGPLEGQEVAYPDLQGLTMLSDGAIFLFGCALLIEAALMLFANAARPTARFMLRLAFLVSLAATVFNVYAAARLFGIGILPLMSLLAIAFGGYMASYQWKMLQSMSPRRDVIPAQ